MDLSRSEYQYEQLKAVLIYRTSGMSALRKGDVEDREERGDAMRCKCRRDATDLLMRRRRGNYKSKSNSMSCATATGGR